MKEEMVLICSSCGPWPDMVLHSLSWCAQVSLQQDTCCFPRTGRHTSAPCSLQTNTLVSHLMNSVLGPKQLLELLTGNNIDCHSHAAVRLILLNQTDTAEDISVHVMSLFKCVQ